jgi:DNA adenine methylase
MSGGLIPGLHLSPLRYPGGKRKLANFVRLMYRVNDLMDGDYAEVYAGGASVALSLLYGQYAARVHINDLDPALFAFWSAARDRTEELCARILAVEVSVEEWRHQRAVIAAVDPDTLDLAVAAMYLNRTNRSGIITGGLIGGVGQTGPWKMDARFEKKELIKRIEKVGRHASRVELYRLDAAEFLRTIAPTLPNRSLLYLDPPYFEKGSKGLYANYYGPDDHEEILGLLQGISRRWFISYDDVPQIRELYAAFRCMTYGISYSAADRYRGGEVAFFSPTLKVPEVPNPARVSFDQLRRFEAALKTA